MPESEEFDLGDFLPDTLNIQVNAAPSTRYLDIDTATFKDPYEKFKRLDPLELLGEDNFRQPQPVPEEELGTPIQECFRGVHVLITGATGFVGKVLMEKLLRAVPHLGHVYLLIRGKRGQTARDRFERLLEDKVFSRMKAEVPHYRDRLSWVEGDISQEGLGLSDQDRRLLTDLVHVVFHSAADVRFQVPLRGAVVNNLVGTMSVLEIAKDMKNLKAFVYISTAYSQCVRRLIEERVTHNTSLGYKQVLACLHSMTDEQLDKETDRIIQGFPNTYTFSKALSEQMLAEECAGTVPCAIFRPSVVVPSYREPVRGWTDNVYGPIGIFIGGGHGVIHSIRINRDLILDSVPVDYVVNCLIAVAWRTATHREGNRLPVYNYVSTPVLPMNWKTITDFANNVTELFPFTKAVWYTSVIYHQSYVINWLSYWLLHRLPGHVLDKVAELSGEKPRLTNLYKRLKSFEHQQDYFTWRVWEFRNDNVMDLWAMVDEQDKNKFWFDVRDMDFKEHFIVSKLGVRYYYLKEKMETLPAAKKRNTWLYWVHQSFLVLCGLAALKVLAFTARALPL